nr:hypothetical protein BaRGS_021677 [Batillaria attramentaria]
MFEHLTRQRAEKNRAKRLRQLLDESPLKITISREAGRTVHEYTKVRVIQVQYLPLNEEPPTHAVQAAYIRWTDERSPTPEPAAEEELWD